MAEQNNKILEVKDLRISFRVDGGTVKAVRGISFDLYKGRTLCIVGESGSGKSVTSRAILGILAKNALVEGGEIIYDGKDLLTISEERFHRIRGSKISMIFQDPLSALDPIIRVGKQLTDPIILKARAARREANGLVKEILDNTKKTAVKNNIAYDENLVKKFIAANLEELSVLEAKEKSIRDKTIWERNVSIANDPEHYPSATLKAASRYINKHEEPTEFVEPKLTKSLSEEEKTALREMLIELIEAADKDYKIDLITLRDTITGIIEGPLSQNVADYKTLKGLIKTVKSVICSFAFKDDEDDTIAVFDTSFAKYVEALKLALDNEKAAKKRDESYTKKGLEIPAFTLKERAKLPEKSFTPADATDLLRELCTKLAKHVSEVILTKLDAKEYVDTFLAYFAKEIKAGKRAVSKAEAKEQALNIMRQVGIPQPEIRFRQYPFEFSGGMRQRIVIAIALSSKPEILICDEPTTALDVTIQAQILELINNLKEELNLSIIFITHDLGVVANMADDIAVMYAGKIVEYGSVDDIFYDPRHPYTWALLASMPDLDTKEKIDAIPGTPPNMLIPPVGDAFAARNKYALAIDFEEEPPLFKVSDTHFASTWLLAPDAPKAVPPEIVTARIKRALDKRNANEEKEAK